MYKAIKSCLHFMLRPNATDGRVLLRKNMKPPSIKTTYLAVWHEVEIHANSPI